LSRGGGFLEKRNKKRKRKRKSLEKIKPLKFRDIKAIKY
jgi:hypothetical protein